MKYKTIFLIITLILFSLSACSKKQEGELETVAAAKNYVDVAKVEIKTIEETVTYSGTLEAAKSAFVGPELSMKIKNLLVKEGDVVKKGQLLAVMDSTQLKQAEAQFDMAKKNYDRMKSLKNAGSVDKQTFDQIESAFKTAQSGYQFVKNNTQITAPFDGIVTLRTKQEGESYSAMLPSAYGDPALFRIVDLDVLKMNLNISDVDINKVKKGQKAYIYVDSEPGQAFIGKVSFVSPEADMMSGTFPCEIIIENKDHTLKPNQYAVTDIVIKVSDNAYVIPKDALIDEGIVFVVKNSVASRKNIKIGLSNENEIEVTDGLEAGDLVVINGAIGLPENSNIVIRNK
jgi:RND family efflux transporter MFP subunit